MSTLEIRVRGRSVFVPAHRLDESLVIVKGRGLKIAEIFDEYWLERRRLPDPLRLIDQMRNLRDRPDVFTFEQRVPAVEPLFDLPYEWDNYAVIHVNTYEEWIRSSITSAARRNIQASQKRGVTVRECPFDDAYISGIMTIGNESPVRQGRKYWHYGKSFDREGRERDVRGAQHISWRVLRKRNDRILQDRLGRGDCGDYAGDLPHGSLRQAAEQRADR